MDERPIGWLIVGVGALLMVVGLLVAAGLFGWFGRLPGDLRFGDGNVRVYAPITTMIVVSVVLTLILSVLRRLM